MRGKTLPISQHFSLSLNTKRNLRLILFPIWSSNYTLLELTKKNRKLNSQEYSHSSYLFVCVRSWYRKYSQDQEKQIGRCNVLKREKGQGRGRWHQEEQGSHRGRVLECPWPFIKTITYEWLINFVHGWLTQPSPPFFFQRILVVLALLGIFME